ncbi:MAG: iron ABC transporter permease [Clostridia bacterium]|nr:iron ABC transporter permease [Clostridia bacterium]
MRILQRSSIPSCSLKHRRRLCLVLLPILTGLCFALALAAGSSDVSVWQAIKDLFSGALTTVDFKIVFYVRLPRALGALLAGSALAVSGVVIQAVLNNPMAAPNIIGVNAGAGFFVILAMAVFQNAIGVIPIAAFFGALFAALLIYAISALTGAGRVTITLVGVAVSAVLTAGINGVKTLFPDSVYDVSGFLVGGLSAVNFSSVLPAGAMILPVLLLCLVFSRRLDALCLGEEVAGGLGVSVKKTGLAVLVLAALLAGAAVSFAGLIGFVGLIVPHIMRRLVGSIHRYLIPVSIFGAGTLLLIADTLSRVLFAPYELPVGILMSLAGGPFFIFLILSKRRKLP